VCAGSTTELHCGILNFLTKQLFSIANLVAFEALVVRFKDGVELPDKFQELAAILFRSDQGAQFVNAVALGFIHHRLIAWAGTLPKRPRRL
jgi:hypothetical protein